MKQRAALARALIARAALSADGRAVRGARRADARVHADRADPSSGSATRASSCSSRTASTRRCCSRTGSCCLRPRPGQVAEVLDVDLPHPRWEYDVRATPRSSSCATICGSASRTWSPSDPQSEFFERAGATMHRPPSRTERRVETAHGSRGMVATGARARDRGGARRAARGRQRGRRRRLRRARAGGRVPLRLHARRRSVRARLRSGDRGGGGPQRRPAVRRPPPSRRSFRDGGVPRTARCSATIPGVLRGLDDLLARFGTRSCRALVAPAHRARRATASPCTRRWPRTRANAPSCSRAIRRRSALFLPGGAPLAEGDAFVQSDLAARAAHGRE